MSKKNLTEGPVWRALAAVSAPMTLGILAVLSVGIVDAYFLGQLGADPLAAVGYIYPTTTAITSMAIGLSAGANAAVSQAIGREEAKRSVARLSLHAFGIGIAVALATAFAFYALHKPLFALMGAGEAVQTEISLYVPYWALSFPFLMAMMIANALFRAHGDAAMASLFMILAAVVNIALNPILIFGWGPIEGQGTAGAAMATLIGRVVAMVAAVAYAIHAGYLVKCGKLLSAFTDSAKTIVHVGAPAAFSNAINPAGMAMVTAAVATLGDTAVAGFGAATRIQSVAIVVMMALSAGIGPVVGQNWGAGKHGRAQRAVVEAWGFCVVYGLALGCVLTVGAEPLSALIASDPEAAAYAEQYLRIVGWSLFGYGILVTANAAMNARSKAMYSMVLGAARTFGVYLPLSWGGVMLFGYNGILAAAVAANVFAVAGAVYFCRRADLLSDTVSPPLSLRGS